MLIGLQKAVINSELQNTVKSRKKKNQVRNDGFTSGGREALLAAWAVNKVLTAQSSSADRSRFFIKVLFP
ncbi:MAG: hypothetical protein ACR5LE_11885 [Symbiopectobacterium sp.]